MYIRQLIKEGNEADDYLKPDDIDGFADPEDRQHPQSSEQVL